MLQVTQEFYWLFQAVEASRAVADEVLKALDVDDSFVFAQPRVTRVSMSSPLEIDITGAAEWIGLLKAVAVWAVAAKYLPPWLERAGDLYLRFRQDRRSDRADNREAERHAAALERDALENQRLTLDVARLRIEFTQQIADLVERHGGRSDMTLLAGQEVDALIENQLIRALGSLLLGGQSTLDVETNTTIPVYLEDDGQEPVDNDTFPGTD